MSDKIKHWIEIDPTYLTDFKKRPIELIFFFNRVRYNPSAKVPVLRRRSNIQTVTVDKRSEIEDAVVAFVMQPNARLLRDGLNSNDFRRLPLEVKRPPKEIVNGTAEIYDVL